jgi:hypothetical protein
VVIKRSAGPEIRALIADLDSEDEVRREAAVGRLAVIGTRAVERLLAALSPPPSPRVTVAALQALEAIRDSRALAPALTLLAHPDADIVAAAAGVTRTFLSTRQGPQALDRLVALALDPAKADVARLAALDALKDVEARTLAPVWERLRADASLAVASRAARESGQADPLAELEVCSAGSLPDDPQSLAALLDRVGAAAPLTTLHRLVAVVAAREARERSRAPKVAWLAVRGRIHRALATRESRVALYDLRELIEGAAGPLPPDCLAALTAIGDAASLEALAAAYARATGNALEAWQAQIKATFAAIMAREHIGPRHAALKRIENRWPDAAKELVKGKRR